jgi:indole-3-glycerol phosphate synthase
MFLDEALAAARQEAAVRMRSVTSAALERSVAGRARPPDFRAAITRDSGGVRVIAEVKRSSPSAGSLREGADAGELARAYGEAGADAVSVITSSFKFGGKIEDLEDAASAAPGLPLLRKDFIVEPYQVLEARTHGASAVLLISAALTPARLRELMDLAAELQMDSLVEAHHEEDLDRAIESGSTLIGINNRDLVTLAVDLATTERLLPLIPAGSVVVSESGIATSEQLKRVEGLGVDAVLIGEALMRAPDAGVRLKELTGRPGLANGDRAGESSRSTAGRDKDFTRGGG